MPEEQEQVCIFGIAQAVPDFWATRAGVNKPITLEMMQRVLDEVDSAEQANDDRIMETFRKRNG